MNKEAIYKKLPKWAFDIIKEIETQVEYSKWLKAGKPCPPNHSVKRVAIRKYQKESGYKTLVETGTYMGDMIYVQMNYFDELCTIELSEHYYKLAVERFKRFPKVKPYHGDSATKLGEITPKLNAPAIFWLDGHYSGGLTAKGASQCPVFGELDAILATPHKHIILIDDARLFTGSNDYPTIEEVKLYLQRKNMKFDFSVEDDIIRIILK
ncbi:MAG: hypothetical protein ACOYOT_01580 [Bacteroidales bacterium]